MHLPQVFAPIIAAHSPALPPREADFSLHTGLASATADVRVNGGPHAGRDRNHAQPRAAEGEHGEHGEDPPVDAAASPQAPRLPWVMNITQGMPSGERPSFPREARTLCAYVMEGGRC